MAGRPDADSGYAGDSRNVALESEIHDLIRSRGPISFADFMEMALYHPEHGYYSGQGEKLGPRGDFYTSPENHPVFGELVGRQLAQMWHVLGQPEEFTIVEVGAGSGSLCSQIIRFFQKEKLFEHLRYVIVEKSPDLARKQREALHALAVATGGATGGSLGGAAGWAGRVSWFEPTQASPLPSRFVGCFLSNELLDAFPVHRVIMQEGHLREIYVGLSGDELVDVIGDPSTPSLGDYFADLGIELQEGARAEVNLGALEWIRRAGSALKTGFILTIDYGLPAEDLFSPKRREGTLMSYYRHTLSPDPYAHIGKQDMTTHVDFTSVIRAGRAAGLNFVGFLSQCDFLTNLGMEAYLAALDSLRLSPARLYDNKFAMRRLVNLEALGKFKVLVQRKGFSDVELDCFNPCNDTKRELIIGKRPVEVPLLPVPNE